MNKIPKDRRLKEATKAGSFYTIWTKKQYIWEEWTKERGLGLGELISKEVTRVVYIAFLAPNSVSGDEAASLPLGTGRAPFTRGGDLFPAPTGTKEGQSVLLAPLFLE